jgi:hypothetical protein
MPSIPSSTLTCYDFVSLILIIAKPLRFEKGWMGSMQMLSAQFTIMTPHHFGGVLGIEFRD